MYAYLKVSLAWIRTVQEILNGSEVIHCMLATKRMVCWFRFTRKEHMLSLHRAEPAYGTVYYYLNYLWVPKTLLMHYEVSLGCLTTKFLGLRMASKSQWLYARLQAYGMLVLRYRRGAHMVCPRRAEPAYCVILSECTFKYIRLSWCGKTSHLVHLKKFLGPWMAWKSQWLCDRLQAYGMLVPGYAGRAYAVSEYSWVSITWDIMCVWLCE